MAETVEKTCYRHPDRVTGLSCSECGRPICTECMTMAPVGIRCPDHSGKPRGAAKITHGARRWSYEGTGSIVTKALIGINVVVYLFEIASGGINGPGVAFQLKWALYGPAVANGDWYRLITAGVLHAYLIHTRRNRLILALAASPPYGVVGAARD